MPTLSQRFSRFRIPVLRIAGIVGLLAAITASAQETLKPLESRKFLDQTVWRTETQAQMHERVFTAYWDHLRASSDKLRALDWLPFQQLHFRALGTPTEYPLQITAAHASGAKQSFSHPALTKRLDTLAQSGLKLVSTEWHHQTFDPPRDEEPARSQVTFLLNLEHPQEQASISVTGILHVTWLRTPNAAPKIDSLRAEDIEVSRRTASSGFARVASIDARDLGESPFRLHPLILYDLDRDGLSELILGGVNTVHWNRGNGQFERRPLLSHWRGEIGESAIVADFDGDTHPDFLCITARDRIPVLFRGNALGQFSEPGRPAAQAPIQNASVLTAGDVDADGDLDLYVTQYRRAYTGGQMPTPFFDANDGYPAYLLLNDGKGQFTDHTESAGLAAKRFRRTYSSSFVDLDHDHDLDLLVVSDFAGVDVYTNDGQGHFTDVRDEWVEQWHNFGMAHTVADFNLDGRLDFYVIGMSSTTMRRLNYMKLNRPGYEDHGTMRTVMGYGNRLYLNQGKGFQSPAWAHSAARTGWSWGTTAFDFDNDGDEDLYVANGFISGDSTQDYCTTFWCHDIYTGNSKPNSTIATLLNASQLPIMNRSISWNGYEHNKLLVNDGETGFRNVAHLLGTALNQDCRGVASDDLNGDGRMDLLVVEERWEGNGKKAQILHVLANALPQPGNWIGIRLENAPAGTSPIGATVRLTSAAGEQIRTLITGDSFYSQHAPVAHFGIGSTQEIESLEVVWPNQTRTKFERPAINRYHSIQPVD